MNISVAMASYNGEKYIQQQIDSILPQLNDGDELIISDDGSTDKTIDIVQQYIKRDARIKYLNNDEHGVIKNYENAISNCQNDLIFLCDQDDIWKENKVKVMKEEFSKNKNIMLVMSDISLVDNDLNILEESFFKMRGSKKGILKNILKNSYIGCAIAFRKELLPKILPFPKAIPMHDMWIGILAEIAGDVVLVPESLSYYRRHDENVTSVEDTTSLFKKLTWRFILVKELVKRKNKN